MMFGTKIDFLQETMKHSLIIKIMGVNRSYLFPHPL
jgi:hypothetical protein